jgi:hypothetical protein
MTYINKLVVISNRNNCGLISHSLTDKNIEIVRLEVVTGFESGISQLYEFNFSGLPFHL